jgi:endonuclease G
MKTRIHLIQMQSIACCLAALLFLPACFYSVTPQHPSTSPPLYQQQAEIPTLQNGRKEQIIHHEGYTVSYNPDYKIATWVAYELTAAEARSQKVKKKPDFDPDPEVPSRQTATKDDYSGSGYDRGHLAPAGDMKWSCQAMLESFYFSNICPQDPSLNSGVWNQLEQKCREWAIDYGSVLIVTGPLTKKRPSRIGPNKVAVPQGFFKVICIRSGGKAEGIGFVFDNEAYKGVRFMSMAISIDSVEKLSEIDFFPSFPLAIQAEMESATDWSYGVQKVKKKKKRSANVK